jgi:predicted transcriptional regulator
MLTLTSKDPSTLAMVGRALSTELRIAILNEINKSSTNVVEIAKKLGYPVSTISSNLNILEEAGLITSEYVPAKNGSMKICSIVYNAVNISLVQDAIVSNEVTKHVIDIPIGHYTNCEIHPTCGLYSDNGYIGNTDDSAQAFYFPERINAKIIWFRRGYLEYKVPLLSSTNPIKAIDVELELCSEYPGSNNGWKSDITMWINDVEIGTWTSPSDFGERRGRLTPEHWPIGNTQHGLLKTWFTGDKDLRISDYISNDIKLSELNLEENPYISIKIGVKDDAENQGGINLFGKKFGDYDQDIRVSFYY